MTCPCGGEIDAIGFALREHGQPVTFECRRCYRQWNPEPPITMAEWKQMAKNEVVNEEDGSG